MKTAPIGKMIPAGTQSPGLTNCVSQISIPVMIDGFFVIFAQTKVLSRRFSGFLQTCPAGPGSRTGSRERAPPAFFTVAAPLRADLKKICLHYKHSRRSCQMILACFSPLLFRIGYCRIQSNDILKQRR